MDQVSDPVFSPSAGHYSSPKYVSLSSTTPEATIYYTTDGRVPTTASTKYTDQTHIWAIAGLTLKAIAVKSGYQDSSVVTATYSYSLPVSGQITSYLANDDGATQLGIPISFTVPTAHTTYSSDYTTTDAVTGLTWNSCSQLQSGPGCAAPAATAMVNNDTASDVSNNSTTGCLALNSMNSGKGYAGITTWRVPDINELYTSVDLEAASPAVYITYFPGTSGNYWSSSVDFSNPTSAFYVNYNGAGGAINLNLRVNSNKVRCVSGNQRTLTLNMTDQGDGTIKDNVTGLYWQKCALGQSNDATCSGAGTTSNFGTGISDCNSLSLAGKSWRLPNSRELNSIVNRQTTSANFNNTSVFPNAPIGEFWSSTTYASSVSEAWYVDFLLGELTHDVKGNIKYIRCVSGP